MSNYLTGEQVNALLRQINPVRVSSRDGLSHLEAYDVRAHLNRVFGFARWSADLIDLTVMYDEQTLTKAVKAAYSVGYRATVKLTVNAPDGTFLASYTEAATGGAVMPDFKRADAHDFAIKTAESQALKRCAINLGDQFGLSLYAKGSKEALVRRTLVQPDSADEVTANIDGDVAPVVPEHVEQPDPDITTTSTAQVAAPTPPPLPVPSPDASAGEGEPQLTPEKDVERLRAAVIEAKRKHRREALPELGRINIEAGKRKLMNLLVADENGEQKTVGMFLQDAINSVMSPKAGAGRDAQVAS